MSQRAWVYVWSVLVTGAMLVVLALADFSHPPSQWMVFGVLVVLATAAQLYEAEHGRQSFYPHFVFFVAAVWLLHPFLFILVVIIPHLFEWVKERLRNGTHLRAWYIQPFNIATHIIAGAGAYGISASLGDQTTPPYPLPSVFVVMIGALLFVVTNHVLVGLALLLARGVSLRESRVLAIDCLLPDIVMAFLGCSVAVLWSLHPWWVILALSPLALMYQALMVPQLKQEAQTDSKTGLLNARHFAKEFTAELERAKRFNRPLAFIMADLDLLRNINNTYGHLAGDAVLTGIAKIIRETIRTCDLASRFGGEEFAIVLPETDLDGAKALAERLRAAIEAASFEVSTNSTPISATMSLGIACFPQDATTLTDLTHEADVAVYQAKFQGRNRVVCAAAVPHTIKLSHPPTKQTAYNAELVAAAKSAEAGVKPVADSSPTQSSEHSSTQSTSETPKLPSPKPATLVSGTSAAETSQPQAAAAPRSNWRLWAFVSAAIVSGVSVALFGATLGPVPDFTLVILLAALGLLAELFQIDVYGRNTVSVSVGVAFAAALVAGIPGAVGVSAAIVLAHSFKRRPQLHRAAFNWATHVLAGAVPAFTLHMLAIPLQVATLPVLIVPMAFVALAYYLVDTGLIAGAISLSTGARFVKIWQDQFKWLAVHYLVLCGIGLFVSVAYTTIGLLGIGICVLPLFLTRYAQKQYVERTEDGMRELQRMNGELAQANREILAANLSIQYINDELFETLARFFDARDPYVGGHAAKVADYATAIARELGLTGERLTHVRQAGLLHDIGKIAIPEQILNKPGKLTDAEYECIKTHTTIGAELLQMSQGLRHLAPFVLYHHERWDGQGYPSQLSGVAIPLEARILNVCDSVEAMASDRPYHVGMSVSEIIAELKRNAGSQFDPTVAEVFIRIIEREGEEFIVNSAREVVLKQVDKRPLVHMPVAS